MDLKDLREQIDQVDRELVQLFSRRMAISADIAQVKADQRQPVWDPGRERKKLKEVAQWAGPALEGYTRQLYATLFQLSRQRQRRETPEENPLLASITQALEQTPPLFPEQAQVAVQGVEGAYAQSACEKLFRRPAIMHFNSFEGVFRAVDQGLCRYGVLPLENSTAGSVNRIYDLMTQYQFAIVRSTRLKIDHCLLTLPGARLEDIREVVSHEQALTQSEGFLRSLGDVKVTVCQNTAMAAKQVLQSGRKDLAALSSRSCAELYGLHCLKAGVQDSQANFTRFICLSKQLEIYPGADKTSVMMVLPHKPGSLYQALGQFYALGINLIKLESRPLAGSDFEFMFYFDLETSVYSPEFTQLFRDLPAMPGEFRYLGSYSEVV